MKIAMNTKKRERSVNFTNAEVQLLMNLVNKHKHIVENKKTDGVTNKNKYLAWKKIEYSFNSCGITPNVRTWKTLKLKYEGIKKFLKKKSYAQQQEWYRTGEGSSNAADFNNVDEKVLNICSNIQAPKTREDAVVILKLEEIEQNTETEKEDLNDDDPLIINKHIIEDGHETQQDSNESMIFNVKIEDKDKDETEKDNKWDRCYENALKSRMSNVSSGRVAKGSVASKLDQLRSSRNELVQLEIEIVKRQKEFAEEEQKLKMQHLARQHELVEEEHKLKMQHLANDERRREEIHALLLERLKSGPITPDMLDRNLLFNGNNKGLL